MVQGNPCPICLGECREAIEEKGGIHKIEWVDASLMLKAHYKSPAALLLCDFPHKITLYNAHFLPFV